MKDAEPIIVLVIDGDTVRRGMLACVLPPTDYVVEFAKSAEVGLDLLGRLHPTVILIGLDDSTADLCQRIRQLPAGDACALMVMDERLGEPMQPDVAGADLAMPFPFDLACFEQQLAEHRRRPRTARQVPAAAVDEGGEIPAASQTTVPGEPRGAAGAIGGEGALAGGPVSDEDAWRSFRCRVDRLHDNLAELDYFQLLEVPRGASGAQIKEAYFRCSIEFHPDRFIRLQDEQLKVKNYEVYKRMTEAFRVLAQPTSRAAYVADDLEAPGAGRSVRYSGGEAERDERSWSQASTPTGCRYLRFAQLAYEAGNLRSAKKYLTLAAEWEPGNADLRRRLDEVSAELK